LDAGFGNVFLSDWSLDGRWLYFSAERNGRWDIWRLVPDGSPASGVVQVTAVGAIRGHECADGNFYYSRPHKAGLWRLSLDTIGLRDPPEDTAPPWLPDGHVLEFL
jgi:hypothetical protein